MRSDTHCMSSTRIFVSILFSGALAQAVAQSSGVERFEQREPCEVPGAFTYDPLTGQSVANRRSAQIAKAYAWRTKTKSGRSFTIEAFAKPADKLSTRPRDVMPVFQVQGKASSFMTGILRSKAPHSYNWWQARIDQQGVRAIDLGRGRYNGIGMVRDGHPWRHLALVWDQDAMTARFYLEYRLQSEAKLERQPDWDLSSVMIGGAEGRKNFTGWIDEVRMTQAVLPPWHFQRATTAPLHNVSFAPEKTPALPDDYGHIDVRLHYGAVGDGEHDDTEAIKRAFAENDNRVPIEYQTVYFPEGNYLISDMIRFRRFMVVRGAGREKTRITLKDRSQGYQDPKVPRAAFAVGYDWPYVNRSRRQRAGNAIGSYIFDISIHTGKGNPAVLGLDFHCNNVGCVENVDIISGDGQGLVGLDFKRGWPGPCLMRDIRIHGFDVGIGAAHREYSLVFSGIELKNQNVVAISNGGNVLSLENVASLNRVPAVQNRGGGLITLINSRLRGGDAKNTAIQSDNASIYLRNVVVDGYGSSIVESQTPKGGTSETIARRSEPEITEYFTGPFDHPTALSDKGSLKLPIKQTPRIARPPLQQWQNVRDFEDLVMEGDWAAAIQAAVDAGKPLVYFPAGAKYLIKQDVVIRGAVRTFFGGSPKTEIDNGTKDSGAGPALVLDPSLPQFQFDLLGTKHVRHEGPTALVFRHCGTRHVSAGPDCGDLFIEDTGGPWRFNRHQRVWGRQMNPETKGVPEIINDGGQFWVLGMKTEYLSTKIVNRNGAQTEVLGGLMYPVHPVNDETLPMFINEDSDMSLVHGVSVYKKNHKIYLREVRTGRTTDSTTWRWVNGRPIANVFRSSR